MPETIRCDHGVPIGLPCGECRKAIRQLGKAAMGVWQQETRDNFALFTKRLQALDAPLPWRPDPDEPGAVIDARGDTVLQVDQFRDLTDAAAIELAQYITCGINACGRGFAPNEEEN